VRFASILFAILHAIERGGVGSSMGAGSVSLRRCCFFGVVGEVKGKVAMEVVGFHLHSVRSEEVQQGDTIRCGYIAKS
jgi:hypothetical protein